MIKKAYLLAWLVFVGARPTTGQEKYQKQDIIQKMNSERYVEAFPLLEKQYPKFPKDPDYIFYTGACRVQVGQNIEGALTLLQEASSQGVHHESWFYLGRAYLLNYNFENAMEAFQRFGEIATRDEKENVRFELYQSMCHHAIDLCSTTKNFIVLKIDTLPENELYPFLNKKLSTGRFEKTEESNLIGSKNQAGTCYTCSDGNQVFLSRCSFGKKQKDLFFSGQEDIDLNKFKTLGYTVNTNQDEDFVYFDESTSTLYFSSQGHQSAGGYDIFRSDFDKVTEKWSTPVNMGFPINTPYDEIAYVTLPGSRRAFLASKRNARLGKVVVYSLEMPGTDQNSTTMLAAAKDIANLKPGKVVTTNAVKEIKNPTKPVGRNSNEAPAELKNEKSYQKLIREALSLQIRSDSVRRLSDEKKELLINARDEHEKTKIWQEIRALDEKADEIQVKADELYKKARATELEKQNNNTNSREMGQKAFSGKKNPDTPPAKISNDPSGTDFSYTITFRIQIGIFTKPLSKESLKNFSPVLQESVNKGTATKYCIGLYHKSAEAEKDLIRVKNAGFKDAFLIGFYNGKLVPLSRAKELENASAGP